MRNLEKRMDRIETKLMPSERIIVLFARQGHESEDHVRQLEEYRQLYGSTENLICIIVRGCHSNTVSDENYEDFIARTRNIDDQNSFTNWWQVRSTNNQS